MLREYGLSVLLLVMIISPLRAGETHAPRDNDIVYEGRRVSEWVQMLGSPDAGRQSLAASTLVAIGEPAVPQLLAGLKGNNDRIRIAAANTLSEMVMTPNSVLPALLGALNDPSEEVRRAVGLAICKLISLGRIEEKELKAAVPALVKARKHKDPRVRQFASCALALIQRDKASPGLVDGLIEAVKVKETEVQEHALVALWWVGPAAKSALPALQDLLKQMADVDMRFKAVMAIAAADPKSKATMALLIKALQENSSTERGRSGGSAMQYSLVADELGHIGPLAKEAIEPLSRALRDPEAIVRVSAALALSRIAPEKTREMVRVLIGLLKHEDSLVRGNAVSALYKIGPMAKEAVAPLADLIRKEKNPLIREQAKEALKKIAPDKKEKGTSGRKPGGKEEGKKGTSGIIPRERKR
jgi:HEAT repeat protein